MLQYYKENIQLYAILISWILVGAVYAPATYAFIPITMYLMYKKGMIEELLIGYLFVLILSDSLESSFYFAKDVKNIYISILALFFFFDSNNFQPLNNLYKIFIPFFIFSIFTLTFSFNDAFIFTSIQKTLSYALTFMVIPNYVIKLYREEGEEFFRRLILFAFTILLLGFVLKFIAPEIAHIENGRFRGFMGNPNGLGLFSFLLFVLFYIVNDLNNKLFVLYEKLLVYSIILISIYLTDSRNAVLTILIFYLFQRFFSVSPFLGFIVFIVTVFLVEIVSNNLTTILLSLGLGEFFRIDTLGEGSGRYIAWDFAWKQIQENFFIGKGFGYNEFFMRQHYKILTRLGHEGGIHNSFLTFWMDQGLIGLVIFLRSYILMFIKAAQKTKFAIPILFAISFSALFESWLVGSLSAYAFMAMVIYTFITSEEIVKKDEIETQAIVIT